MVIGAGAPTDEHDYTLNEDYSPVIAEARAVFEQFGLRDIQTALQVLAVHELQKLNERLDSLAAADSGSGQRRRSERDRAAAQG